MLVTLLGSVTLWRLLQEKKVWFWMLARLFPNRDAGQAAAPAERAESDAYDAIADPDAGQAGAVLERLIANADDAVRDRNGP